MSERRRPARGCTLIVAVGPALVDPRTPSLAPSAALLCRLGCCADLNSTRTRSSGGGLDAAAAALSIEAAAAAGRVAADMGKERRSDARAGLCASLELGTW